MIIVPDAATTTELVGSDRNASKGALVALFLSGTTWIIGFNYFQYLLGSKLFPLGTFRSHSPR